MSVYRKPGSKFWWYEFTFRGLRIQRSSKATNRREAENIEKAAWTQYARSEVSIGEKPKAARKTIAQLLDMAEKDLAARKKDARTNLNLIGCVRSEIGDVYADALSTERVTEYVASLRKPSRKHKGRKTKCLSNSSIKHRLQVLRSCFALENAARAEQRLDLLITPRFPKLQDGEARSGFLGRPQFDLLRSHLPADLKDFALFGYLTGWRRGAIASLEWSDVRDDCVFLRGSHSKNGKPYFLPIVGELSGLIERRKKARVFSPLVFHRQGEPIVEFRKAWRTACKRAGLDGRLFHDLRRSAARNLIRSGVSKDVAKAVGGWKTESMFSRYNVCAEEDLRDAMQKVTKYNEAESQKVASIRAVKETR